MSEQFHASRGKRTAQWFGLIFLCVVACAVHALYFVESAIRSLTAQPGYASDWHFLLLMFALFRLPIWIAGFVLAALSVMLTSTEEG